MPRILRLTVLRTRLRRMLRSRRWTQKQRRQPSRFERSGVAVLKAKLGTESAVVIVNIVSNIRKVAIEGTYTDDKALIDDGQMNNNGKLNLSVKVTPDANKGDAVSAKWTITSGLRFRRIRKKR